MNDGTSALCDRKIVAESACACAGSTITPKETIASRMESIIGTKETNEKIKIHQIRRAAEQFSRMYIIYGGASSA